MKRQKNIEFVTLLLVTGIWKDAILKCGIVLQIEIQDRKKEGKRKICENDRVYFLVNIIKTEKRTNNWISSTKSNAQIFYTVLNEKDSDFADSSGWAQRYGKLYGMRHRNICENKLSVKLELYLKITDKPQPVVTNEKLSVWELYNGEETGLNFKLLPSIILIYNIHNGTEDDCCIL
jgi:hypothetical protein